MWDVAVLNVLNARPVEESSETMRLARRINELEAIIGKLETELASAKTKLRKVQQLRGCLRKLSRNLKTVHTNSLRLPKGQADNLKLAKSLLEKLFEKETGNDR
jgi:chromosome segregation ATPase